MVNISIQVGNVFPSLHFQKLFNFLWWGTVTFFLEITNISVAYRFIMGHSTPFHFLFHDMIAKKYYFKLLIASHASTFCLFYFCSRVVSIFVYRNVGGLYLPKRSISEPTNNTFNSFMTYGWNGNVVLLEGKNW